MTLCTKQKIHPRMLRSIIRQREAQWCLPAYSYKCQICGALHITSQDPEIRITKVLKTVEVI